MSGDAITNPPARKRTRPAPALKYRNRSAQHYRWMAKWITRTELTDLLAQGLSHSDIARRKNVYDNQVFRAVNALEAEDLRRAISILADTHRRSQAIVVPPRIEGPVDPVDDMLRARADIEMVRDWAVNSQEGKELAKPRQIGYIMQTVEATMRWCSVFVDLRHKLLELIAVDTWITELTDMLRDIQREHAAVLQAAGLDLRQIFLDRIRSKILGRSVERVPREVVAESEILNATSGNGAPSAD